MRYNSVSYACLKTQPEEILAVTAAGGKMPQKTTCFYPKLIDGLVMNKTDAEEEIAD